MSSHRSDAGRKVATNVSEPMKAKLINLAGRNKMTLSEYVRKVLFDHVHDNLPASMRPVKTGSSEYVDEIQPNRSIAQR